MAGSSPSAVAAPPPSSSGGGQLTRELGLLGLVSTALCAMIGVGINIIPFMIQRSKPGIGAAVPVAYVVAAVPAALAALCYAILSSAMPRAGGSYVYATRALDPFLGFLGAFAQWFGLSMGMGVVAYLFVPMVRDMVATAGFADLAPVFDRGDVRLPLALAAIWVFWAINRSGVKAYERTVVVMAVAMIVGPVIMTAVGFATSGETFMATMAAGGTALPPDAPLPASSASTFLGACVVLFSSFIGFDAIAQAGGEATRPTRNLPLAIVVAMASVTVYYVVFTAAVYHAVPWAFIYRTALVRDVSAPALLAPLLSPFLGVLILFAVTMAILNSIPSVMLANSRLLYAFGADRVFPAFLAHVHPSYRTPDHALTATALFGSASVVGCHFAGDFFLGVDMLVVSMLLNFLLMALAVLTFPRANPALHRHVAFLASRGAQIAVGGIAALSLGALLVIQLVGDLRAPTPWYFKSTTTWIMVMAVAAAVFGRSWRTLKDRGVDPRAIFSRLPDE
ncbi:MAG: APC family permease [Vicinamibacterales bacterium]